MLSLSSTIFDELFSTIDVIGIDMTLKKLREAKSCGALKMDDEDIDFILNTVVETVGIDKARIINGHDRSDDRKIAMSICVYCIREHFSYSYTQLRKIFNKDESALHKYYSYIKKIPIKPKTNFDKTLDSYHKKVETIIAQEKKNKK